MVGFFNLYQLFLFQLFRLVVVLVSDIEKLILDLVYVFDRHLASQFWQSARMQCQFLVDVSVALLVEHLGQIFKQVMAVVVHLRHRVEQMLVSLVITFFYLLDLQFEFWMNVENAVYNGLQIVSQLRVDIKLIFCRRENHCHVFEIVLLVGYHRHGQQRTKFCLHAEIGIAIV